MIFLRFFLGILVICFLPGFALVKRSNLSIPFFSKISFVLFFSIMMMFQVSLIATLSGALWLYWAYFFGVLILGAFTLKDVSIDSLSGLLRGASEVTKNSLLGCFLFVLLLAYLAANFSRFDGVFSQWDAIVSWNRWALDWYHGIFPRGTYHYPQLMPSAWGAIYRFTGHDYQFLAVFLIPTIVFLYLFSIAEHFKESKGLAVVNLLMIYLWISRLFDVFLFDGYVDVALIAATGVALSFLYRAHKNFELGKTMEASIFSIFSVLIACAATLIKQGGGLILAFVLLEAFLLNLKLAPKEKFFRKIAFFTAILVLPFYLYIQYRIFLGTASSEVSHVMQGIYNGVPPWQRLINAIQQRGFDSIYFISCLFFAFIFNGWKRRLSVFTFLLFVLWGMFFSYDHRNLSVGFAACAFTYGLLFGDLILKKVEAAKGFFQRNGIGRKSLLWAFIPFLVILFFVSRNNPQDKLDFHNSKLKIRAYASPEIAYFLYHGWNKRCVSLYSEWELSKFLPEFEQIYHASYTKEDSPELRADLERIVNLPEHSCLILAKISAGPLEEILQNAISKNTIKQVYESGEYRFFERQQ